MGPTPTPHKSPHIPHIGPMWGPHGTHLGPTWAAPPGSQMGPRDKTHVGPTWAAHMGPIWVPHGRAGWVKCMYTNENCLSNKKTELQARIKEYQPHIIGLTEVWIKEQFSIEGYHPAIHKHRANDRIGGVFYFLCKTIFRFRNVMI